MKSPEWSDLKCVLLQRQVLAQLARLADGLYGHVGLELDGETPAASLFTYDGQVKLLSADCPIVGEYFRDTDTRPRLLGSTSPEKLEFDGEKCRTTQSNEAVALCLSIDGHSSSQKKPDTDQ